MAPTPDDKSPMSARRAPDHAGGANPAPAGADSSSQPKTRNVDSLVADLRQELLSISSHELELRQREQDFEQEYRELRAAARQAARAELAQERRQLAARAEQLNAQAADIAQRRERLEQMGHELRMRESKLRVQRTELEQRTARMLDRAQNLGRRFRQQRQGLRYRIGLIREREQELDRRLRRARDDVRDKRTELEGQRTALAQSQATLDAREAELRRRQEELDERERDIASRQGGIDEQAGVLQQEYERLQTEHQRLQELAAELASQRQSQTSRQRVFDERWQTTHQQRHELARQVEELEARRRALQNQRAAEEERAKRLAEREREFEDEVAALAEERDRLAEFEQSIVDRENAVAAKLKEAAEIERKARLFDEQTRAHREQVETRELEARRAALDLEVQREELEREAESLEDVRGELDGIRVAREKELDHARGLLVTRARQIQVAASSIATAPARWWVRASTLALAAGIAAALAWLAFHPLQYRASATLFVRAGAADEAPGPVDLNAHRRALLDPALLDDANVPADDAARWAAACAAGRVRVEAWPDVRELKLTVIAVDADAAGALCTAAADAYAASVNRVAALPDLPPTFHDLHAWRETLRAEQARLQAEQAALEEQLDGLPAPAQRDALLAAADRAQAELVAATDGLQETRAQLAVLLAAEVPTGHVDDADVAAQTTEDSIYQEDRKEYQAVALKYRAELIVGMMLVADPASKLADALREAADALAEQRALNPPAELVGVLEASAAGVARLQEQVSAFNRTWRSAVEQIEQLDMERDIIELSVAELVDRRRSAADLARKLGDQARQFIEENAARIETLADAQQQSTRAVVVTSMLRGEHATLQEVVADYQAAIGQVSTSENVKLDTHDRQLRGLQMRLEQRRQLVREQLQLDADQQARAAHTARIDTARAAAREIERKREALATELTETLGRVRALDATVQTHTRVTAERDAAIAAAQRVARQIEMIGARLDAVRRAGPTPDRIKVAASSVRPLEQSRYRDAGLAGSGAFVATWLVCLLMIVKPLGQRQYDVNLAALLGGEEPPPKSMVDDEAT